ncbi:uncharacterized protein LOC132755029 [Ruditapes philippinarum]|uniref:uncharacterized protein LOC132755029 n=1 Tax=Ruditapes philippinarum TaxID=129788 RepID=UPI00295AFB53|nr:uncharacterized protein LOC132755029 [Ruditapes philippinarum]
MDKSVLKRKILFLFGVLVFAFLIFLGRIAEYLTSEYIYCTHNYNANESCAECINKKPQNPLPGKIPQHIHQIFFYETSSQLPDKLVKAKNSWIQYHPNYTYTLWNKTSINSLLEREYPFLKKLYDSYGHWVRRADVARYLVLYHYGGWYVDMDVACRRSVRNLEQEAQELNKTAILRVTEPVGFSNDFIGITKRHPFLFSVLTSLHMSNRWFIFPYANTMFSTGPTFLWGRYLNYRDQNQFYIINNSSYSNYLVLMHNSSWHSWDGIIVWYLFRDTRMLLVVMTSLALFLCMTLFLCKYRGVCPIRNRTYKYTGYRKRSV